MNYLTVKPEGELHVFEGPDRPRSYCAGKPGCCWNERCKILAYDEAMLTASQSSVRCCDQEHAKDILWKTHFNGNMLFDPKKGVFYPIPHMAVRHSTVWLREIDPFGDQISVKTASLTLGAENPIFKTEALQDGRLPPMEFPELGAVEDKQESQEELWEEAESRFIDWHIPEFDIKGLMQEFTITRKGVN